MKLPEKAPAFGSLSKKDADKFFELYSNPEMIDFFKHVNTDYFYWDKFKYLKIPGGESPEVVWLILKVIRGGQMRKIPLLDKNAERFTYWLPDCVMKVMHYIDQHAGGHMLVDDPAVPASEKERYLISSLMEEAIASSLLEGAATTREKAKELLKSGKKPKDRADQMVVNNYITISTIKDLINKPLSAQLIISIQASLTKNTLDNESAVGRFRREKELIQVIDNRDGQVLYDPPPAKEIDERIKALCEFANQKQGDEFIHPAIKAIILHFWLAYIHPFVDGNGRTARALFYWYMLKHGYWLFEYLSISRILLRAPGQYAKAYLYSEMDDLDMTYFLVFNLNAIDLAIRSLHAYLAKQQKEIYQIKKILKKFPGLNDRQNEVLYNGVSHPDVNYTIKMHRNIYNISYETARTDLLELEEKGFFVRELTKGKAFSFVPTKEIRSKIKSIILKR